MFYNFHLTIPANTPILTPVNKEVKISVGNLKLITVQFPSGCSGLVYVNISHYNLQLIPFNYPEYIHSDNEIINIEIDYDIVQGSNQLILAGYNLDTMFEHTIQFRFNIETIPINVRYYSPHEESNELLELIT